MTVSALDSLSARLGAMVGALLRSDPDNAAGLDKLNGRSIELRLRGSDEKLFARIDGAGITLTRHIEVPCDVTLTGSLADFLALARSNRRGESLGAGRIEITGDLAVAQDVQALLATLEIDYEELLSGYVGDVAAYRLCALARSGKRYATDTANRLDADIADYLLHELRATPMRDEVEQFRQDVYALDEQVERVRARLRRLGGRV